MTIEKEMMEKKKLPFEERHKITTNMFLSQVIVHLIVLICLVCIGIIMWKFFSLNTYFIIERITVVLGIILGITISIFEKSLGDFS